MPLFSISGYNLHVKEKRKAGVCHLDDFDSGHDLYETFSKFFSRFQQLTNDAHAKRLMQVGTVRRDEQKRIIEGIVKTGEYGYEAELIDAQTSKLSYKRKTREAEVLPFYFLAHLPKANDTGILLLQRFRQFGIRTILMEYLEDFFRENHANSILSFPPILTREVLKTLRDESIVQAIHVIKYTLPEDKADALKVPKEEVSADYVVRTKRRNIHILGALKERLLGEGNFRIAELEELMPNFDTVKIEVDLGGEKRLVDLAQPKLRTTFDLTDRVRVEANGHPSFENMSGEAKSILRALRRQLEGTGALYG